jgi:hypothetical protein
MGMGKTGFYRKKWEKRENCLFSKYLSKNHWQINDGMF